MGPSNTKGARSPCVLNAQTNVVVRQWPAGAKPRQRWPRGERPRAGVMLVVAQVSSRKISRAALKLGCWALQS
ncbi:MAG: hypothetical protein JWR68_1572 [Polaromonas sp.]|nr:hypothetical protein [Polaromonas sp.]